MNRDDEKQAETWTWILWVILGVFSLWHLTACASGPSSYADHPSAMDRRVSK